MSKRLLMPVLAVLFVGVNAFAAPFVTSYTDGGSWNTVYVQGFRPSLSPAPDPSLSAGSTVYLNGFQFYKSGTADTASNIQLAILSNIFTDLTGLSTSSGAFVGLSTNTLADTSLIPTGSPIPFTFNSLPLTYGNDYAAVFVNVGGGGELTPIRVSALTANYVDVGGGDFHPQTNYGTEGQFQYGTSNFIQTNQFGQFFNIFSYAGDANFTATLDTVPEPASLALLAATFGMPLIRRRRA